MRLITTLLAEDLPALTRMAASASTTWVEVRLDAWPGLQPEGVADLRRATRPKAAIATCRLPEDGGRFRGSELQREALLRAAIGAGFEAVDLEAGAAVTASLLEDARREGVEVVISRHDQRPAAKALADFPAFLAAVPADAIAKYAARVEAPEDLVALAQACAAARAEGLRFAVMGLGDASLRLLAPLLGSELVYCAPDEGPPAAPGQVPARQVAAAHAALPPALQVGAEHRIVALLGDPVAHSLSPPMQNAAFQAAGDPLVYVAVRAPAARLGDVVEGLQALDFAGANITAPHKRAILRCVDRVAKEAQEAQSANTLVPQRGKLVAHSTDGAGAVAALREAGVALKGTRALVLGAGGTGRAIAHALARAGSEVLVTNRTAAKGAALAKAVGGATVPWKPASWAAALQEAPLLVHCTPLGREGRASPVPAKLLRPGLAVFDAVYRPGGTPLVRAARGRGAAVVPGEALLLHQGALAYALWTGKKAPLGPMRAALAGAAEALA